MEAIVKIKTQKGNENISYFLKFLLGVYSAVIVWTVSIGCLQYSHCLNSVYWVSTVQSLFEQCLLGVYSTVIVWTVSIGCLQ